MSEIKALNKLRTRIYDSMLSNQTRKEMENIADEIESEIADCYMLLPVDKNGIPWHIGDMTENRNVVNGIAFDRYGAHFISTLNDIDPSIHTHYKPRTLEDVLRDCCDECYKACKSEYTVNLADIHRKYANEIRELFGGDAE